MREYKFRVYNKKENKMLQDSIEYKIDNIGELKLFLIYPELKELNSLYYNYAIRLPITPCSTRIAVSVSSKY